MTEAESPSAPGPGSEARTAGAMLRAARERQGLHIAALAAAIKVPPAKLDALEHGRYDELTDNTFVRALAQSVCRVLKIDPRPVLDLLPAAGAGRLEKVEGSIRAPFRERPGQEDADEARVWHQPVFWIVMLLLAAAVAFVVWPRRGALTPEAAPAVDVQVRAPKATAPTAPVAAASAPVQAPRTPAPAEPAPGPAQGTATVVTETVHSAPPPAASEPALPAGVVVLRATEPSWVEVSDARGGVLLSRTLQPGESVGLEGAAPWKLTIGNGPATEVLLRGKKVALSPPGRDNVVRMELR